MIAKLFSRRRKARGPRELAPQLTRWQRQALERPGPPEGGLPYATLAAMESDSMIQTALTLKRLGVMAAPYRVVPASERASAKAKAAFVDEAFARMEGSPLTILNAAMDAFGKGWSVQECVYEVQAGRWWLRAVRPKDPAAFGVDVDRFGAVRGLRLELAGEPPVDLPVEKFVVYTHRGGYASPKGVSDLLAAYPHYAAKQTLMTAWRMHLERFASPTMLGAFNDATTVADQEAVLHALNNLASTKAIVYPDQFQISSVGGTTEASRGFMEAIEFHNREIARAILGQTLTTDEGRRVGSLALGKVHLQVLVLQLEALRRDLADRVMTEQVIRPLVEMNFGPGEVPRFEFEPASIAAFKSGRLE